MKRKNRNKPVIDFLSIGEGPEKGPAHKYASMLSGRGRPGQVMAIDVKAPNYEVPRNMAFIRQDAMRFIEGMRSNSVKIVRDDWFYHNAAYGKGRESLGAKDKAIDIIDRIGRAILANPNNPNLTGFSQAEIKLFADIRRNELKYIRAVKKILQPGGRFVLTIDMRTAENIKKFLVQEGFRLRTYKELSEDEIMKSGSPYTTQQFRKGRIIYRIIAVKPVQQ